MESSQPVVPYEVNYICDKCNFDTLRFESTVSTNQGEMYQHICANCKEYFLLPRIYPYIKFEMRAN